MVILWLNVHRTCDTDLHVPSIIRCPPLPQWYPSTCRQVQWIAVMPLHINLSFQLPLISTLPCHIHSYLSTRTYASYIYTGCVLLRKAWAASDHLIHLESLATENTTTSTHSWLPLLPPWQGWSYYNGRKHSNKMYRPTDELNHCELQFIKSCNSITMSGCGWRGIYSELVLQDRLDIYPLCLIFYFP